MEKTEHHDPCTRVLLVDDSPFIRSAVRKLFASEEELSIIGEAVNGEDGLEKIVQLNPDVVLLDINMPVMDGITALKHIMIHHPVPTVMFSTLTRDGATETFDALKYGAVDFLLKPSSLNGEEIASQQRKIVTKIKMAAGLKMETIRFLRMVDHGTRQTPEPWREIKKVCIFAASEGGYTSLIHVLPQLDPEIPAVYIVVFYQETPHIDALIQYLEKYSHLKLRRARDGEQLQAGACYFVPGSDYAIIHRDGAAFKIQVTPSPFPGRRGAANMVMLSSSETFNADSSAVVLSGGGTDGAEGASEISRRGGQVFIQHPGTCLFKEMPRSAMEKCPEAKIHSHLNMAGNIRHFLGNGDLAGHGIRQQFK